MQFIVMSNIGTWSRKMIFSPGKNKRYRQPEGKSIYQLLKMQAEKTPEAIAFTAPERSPLTYGRLLKRVEHTVDTLRACGVNRNDRLAIVLPNGPEMAVAFVAVAAGATCAPLNPSYRINEFDFYLSDLKARALIVGSEMDSPAREVAQRCNIPIIELTPTYEAEAGVFELARDNQILSAGSDFAQPDDT
jgi:acyl-CoA synthetase (AMP-forming)/AMP-acid ligase II